MTTMIAKWVSKKIMKESVSNKFGMEDPYFEQVPVNRMDGTPTGKIKKRRKALPPGISDHDGQILTKVRRRAYRLDLSLFNCCGIRFGWSSVIGIVPVIGDILDAFMAFMVVNTCGKIDDGLPSGIKVRMLFNIAMDFGVGLVPFLGDVADAMFKANTRNAAILEEHLREKGKRNLRQSGMPIPAIDPSDPLEFDRINGDGPPEYTSQPPAAQSEMTSRGRNGHRSSLSGSRTAPTPPAPARTRDEIPRGSGGFFGFGGRARAHDVEMGGNSGAKGSLQKQQPSRR